MSEIKNLQVTEIKGRWTASWDKDGKHFDIDTLYGCDYPRSFGRLKNILDEDHNIVLPSELAVKSNAIQKGFKNVYAVDEKLFTIRKDTDFAREHACTNVKAHLSAYDR